MSLENLLQESFSDQLSSTQVTFPDIMSMLLVATILGIYIFFIYRLVCKKTFYSKSFAISLVAVAIITSIIILAIKQSIVISLGMVGALSIVRFRTPVKEPIDLVFIFWAIAIGIICGANLYEVAIMGSIMITIILLSLHFVPNIHNSLLLVVNANNAINEDGIIELLKQYTESYSIRSRNYNKDSVDFIVEIKIKKDKEQEFLKKITENETIYNVSLMTHDGEIV